MQYFYDAEFLGKMQKNSRGLNTFAGLSHQTSFLISFPAQLDVLYIYFSKYLWTVTCAYHDFLKQDKP